MNMLNEKRLQEIKEVERLAGIGRLGRLMHDPARYLSMQFFQQFIYPVNHKARLERAKTFFGYEMEVLLPAATDIYLTGGKTHDSEIRLAKFMINTLKPGYIYIDIGAHFGYYTLLAADLIGETGKVYAFEAAGKTYEVLKRNTEMLKQVQALHNAVSNQEETITFYEFPILYSEYNSMDIAQFQREGWIKKYKPEKTEVRAVTMDLFNETILKAPDFVKIDVEGAEDKVIAGSMKLLQQHSPVIVMEFLSSERHNTAHTRAVTLLYQQRYQPWAIDKDGKLKQVADISFYMRQNKFDSDNIVFIKEVNKEI